MTGEGHFHERREHAAIGAVVIGQHQVLRAQLRERGRELREQRGRREIRGLTAQLAEHLRERRGAEPVRALAEIDEQQHGRAEIGAQLRRPGLAHVAHGRERGNDQRYGRDHGLALRGFAPHRLHRQGILADGNGDAQRRTQLFAHRAHRGVQRGVLAGLAAGRHPVGRELHVRQRADVGRENVGERLADREPAGRGRIEHRHRRALAHRHRFAGVAEVVGDA